MSRETQSRLRGRWKVAVILMVLVALAVGYIGGRRRSAGTPGAPSQSAETDGDEARIKWWTCSMHPQIHRPEPGRCPICSMELIPVKEEAAQGDGGMRRFATSEAAMMLMDIETAPVERKFVTAEVRMVGKVDYDETRLGYITAWVPGRLDRLYVDYTGVPVKKGDHMVYLYSPELLSAQEELLQAIEAARTLEKSSIASMRESALATVHASREKLRLWGLTREQIARVEKEKTTSSHMTIYAPMGGTVIHKNAQEGMYVKTGTRIYTIADLSRVWVRLDAYESDLQMLRYGQDVEFTTLSYPGEVFKGRIAFIDPFLDKKTRTVKVRVNVDNPNGKLKPEMFVRGIVRVEVAEGGRVISSALAGKWIGPMHPEIVKDKPGKCDICGMDLVPAESLGYASLDRNQAVKPLVIPASAPLITGRRAIVYVRLPDQAQPTFEGREIVLGPRAGDYYIVGHGLREGELVVTHGNFKIDSALQIQAKPSMMTPEGGGAGGAHGHSGTKQTDDGDAGQLQQAAPDEFLRQLSKLEEAYTELEKALEAGQVDRAVSAFGGFGRVLASIDAGALTGNPANVWKELSMLLGNDSFLGAQADNVEQLRRDFDTLKRHWQRLTEQFMISKQEHVSPAGPKTAPAPQAFQNALGEVFDTYLALQGALAADDDEEARTAATKADVALQAVSMDLVTGKLHNTWMTHGKALRDALEAVSAAGDIQGRRAGFAVLSDQLAQTISLFGIGQRPAILLHCPMALDNAGGSWLQAGRDLRNPYLGKNMPKCGDVVRVISAGGQETRGGHGHE